MSIDYEKILLRDCKPYLDELKYCFGVGVRKVLRRGTVTPIRSMVKLKPRTDRKPMSTLPKIHESTDRWFENTFGIKVRSSAIFCSSDKSQSEDYGSSYMVFPVGEYHTFFSPEIKDMYFSVTERNIAEKINPEYNDGLTGSEEYKQALKIIEETPQDEIDQVVFSILDGAGYKKDNLVEALISKNEVSLICNEYYMINPNDQKFIEFFHDYVLGLK